MKNVKLEIDEDALWLAEVHLILQEMLAEGLIEEVTRKDGRIGYINKWSEDE